MVVKLRGTSYIKEMSVLVLLLSKDSNQEFLSVIFYLVVVPLNYQNCTYVGIPSVI
jgi:hypothetical protein